MRLNSVGTFLRRGLGGGCLLGVAGFAVLTLGPGAMSAFEGDSVPFVLNLPDAPDSLATVQGSRVAPAEAEVLGNWEFTNGKGNDDDRSRFLNDWWRHLNDWRHFEQNRRHHNDVLNDVLHSLRDANDANREAAKGLLLSDSERRRAQERADRLDREAANDVLHAHRDLLDAALESHSAALKADADAMLAVYNNMVAHLFSKNYLAIFQDTQQALAIANKAILDARNVSPCR